MLSLLAAGSGRDVVSRRGDFVVDFIERDRFQPAAFGAGPGFHQPLRGRSRDLTQLRAGDVGVGATVPGRFNALTDAS